MKRYLVIFDGGMIQQQVGINDTYLHFANLGKILLFDVLEGKKYNPKEHKWEDLPEYSSPDLIIEEK